MREVTADYILYDAVPWQENTRDEGDNVTKMFNYKVIERFVKGQSKRQADNSVVHASGGAGMPAFWRLAEQTMELKETGQVFQQGNHLERETFEANGTTYAVCDKRFRPESNTSKAMRRMRQSATAATAAATEGLANGWQKAKRPLLWTALAAIVIGAIILLAPTLKGIFQSSGSSQEETAAVQADTTSVANTAAVSEAKARGKDSSTAGEPTPRQQETAAQTQTTQQTNAISSSSSAAAPNNSPNRPNTPANQPASTTLTNQPASTNQTNRPASTASTPQTNHPTTSSSSSSNEDIMRRVRQAAENEEMMQRIRQAAGDK